MAELRARVGRPQLIEAPPLPQQFIADRPKAAFLFLVLLVILDVVYCYLSLFVLYIKIEIGKNRYQM